MAKKTIIEVVKETVTNTGIPEALPPLTPVVTEKAKLEALYKELKDRRINSISDLENLIARA